MFPTRRLIPAALLGGALAATAAGAALAGSPAASDTEVRASLAQGTLTITGTPEADAVALRERGFKLRTLDVHADGDGRPDFRVLARRVDRVRFLGQGAADTLHRGTLGTGRIATAADD